MFGLPLMWAAAAAAARQFPDSSGAWGTAFPSVTTPTNLWLCDDASGDLADSIGVLPMVYSETAGGDTNPNYQVVGQDPEGRYAVEMMDLNSRFRQDVSGRFNLTTTTDAITFFVRCGNFGLTGTPAIGGRPVIGNKTRVANSTGWVVHVATSTGYLTLKIDGSGGSELNFAIAVDHSPDWFDMLITIDRTNNRVRLISTHGDTGWGDITSLGTGSSSLQASTILSLGCVNQVDTDVNSMYSYVAAWDATTFASPDTVFATITAGS